MLQIPYVHGAFNTHMSVISSVLSYHDLILMR